MTEKENIKQLIGEAYDAYCNSLIAKRKEGKTLCDFIADKLVENGIRDINQKGLVAVEGEVSIVPENIIADVKAALDGNFQDKKTLSERDKIIEILRASGYGYFITHEGVNAEEALKYAAEALMACGIGDVNEWKEKNKIINLSLPIRQFVSKVLEQIEKKFPTKHKSEEFENGAMAIISIMREVAEWFSITIDMR